MQFAVIKFMLQRFITKGLITQGPYMDNITLMDKLTNFWSQPPLLQENWEWFRRFKLFSFVKSWNGTISIATLQADQKKSLERSYCCTERLQVATSTQTSHADASELIDGARLRWESLAPSDASQRHILTIWPVYPSQSRITPHCCVGTRTANAEQRIWKIFHAPPCSVSARAAHNTLWAWVMFWGCRPNEPRFHFYSHSRAKINVLFVQASHKTLQVETTSCQRTMLDTYSHFEVLKR